jgi:hypothetical protein
MTIITFGIWPLVWSFQNGDELKARTNKGLGGVAYLFITLFIGPVTMFLMASEVEQLYRREGKEPPITTIWGLWFLLPIIGNIIWYVRIQKSLNEYWIANGYTPAGNPHDYIRGQTPDVIVRRRSMAANTSRQPTMNNPRNSVATITKAVAVPSSNTKCRSSIPAATTIAQMPIPVGHTVVGWRHARRTHHANARAMRNGAAVEISPAIAESRSCSRRPMATNSTTANVSSPAASGVRWCMRSVSRRQSRKRRTREQMAH